VDDGLGVSTAVVDEATCCEEGDDHCGEVGSIVNLKGGIGLARGRGKGTGRDQSSKLPGSSLDPRPVHDPDLRSGSRIKDSTGISSTLDILAMTSF
jgi:hypothetical protein